MPRTIALPLSVLTWVVIFGFLATTTPAFAAPKEIVLYSFCSQAKCADGDSPSNSGLILDTAGNLYGTTAYGGAYGGGVVFQLTRGASGTWSEKILYSFCPSMYQCNDGAAPGSLIFDAAGNLYGATAYGGHLQDPYCNGFGCGTVFQLKPGSKGSWTEKVLYRFGRDQGQDDGIIPIGNLAFDTVGNLYGTTSQGGTAVGWAGTVFELSPSKSGEWTEKVLQSFSTLGSGGEFPIAGLTIGASGRLYGTTEYGGAHRDCAGNAGCGTVFQLTPDKHGKWSERVIHSFNGSDGYWPFSLPAVDAAGDLYVTTPRGGASGRDYGTVVELIPAQTGKWSEKVLRSFFQPSAPSGGVVLDAQGNLFGTTWFGGHFGNGTAFELSYHANGGWVLTSLHSFGGSGDGFNPASTLIFDTTGNLYGTTEVGGAHRGGVVFEITP